ncbi:MAG: hypothetical protein HETSPECPRED_005547 [Heterodermia speciosa]|uniref:Stress-response A/B barrel domain-containing protein n=1 Tax=Heterodermia speciosa TaxID=116794 RepID=A0A8H3IMB4_9LECA|nr:MAG: hypothetical protein HETSPECPRED_005547 [Heterodermia speciosa]
MPVYHVLLFKLKPGVSQEQIDGFCEAGRQMVGKVPGLRDFQVGPALAVTAHRAKGYDMGVVAILENVEDMPGYGLHPAHREY